MVGRTNKKQAVVALKPIELVEEERAIAIIDERVQIFKDEHAWGHFPRL